MNAFEISDEKWPIVIVRTGKRPTDADYADMLARLDELYNRCEPVITVVDTTQNSVPNAHQIGMCVRWVIDNHGIVKRYSIGVLWVVRSIMANMAITTINRLAPPPGSSRVFVSLDGSLSWCENTLKTMSGRALHELRPH